jgi:hypothetical protein
MSARRDYYEDRSPAYPYRIPVGKALVLSSGIEASAGKSPVSVEVEEHRLNLAYNSSIFEEASIC